VWVCVTYRRVLDLLHTYTTCYYSSQTTNDTICLLFSIIFDCRLKTLPQLSRYIASGRPQQKTPFPNYSPTVIEVCLSHRCIISAGTCLPSRCVAMNVYSGSAIPALRHHVTMFSNCPVTTPCNSLATAEFQLAPLFTHRPSGDLFLLMI
jgi:hypothetical protein